MRDNKNPVPTNETQGSCRNERMQTIELSVDHKKKVVNSLSKLHGKVSDFLQDLDSEHYPINYLDIYTWAGSIFKKSNELVEVYLEHHKERRGK